MLGSVITAPWNHEHVEKAYGFCLECNDLAALGNGLCITCWDAGIDAEDLIEDIFTENRRERAA